MNETYCGKCCTECVHKEQMECLGCKDNTGERFGGECRITVCCRNTGKETCTLCGFKEHCVNFSHRDEQPELRMRQNANKVIINETTIEKAKKNNEMLIKRSKDLSKWILILFWLTIISTAVALLTELSDYVATAQGIDTVGTIISLLCMIISGLILIKSSYVTGLYRTAGIFRFISLVVNFLVIIFVAKSSNITLNLLTSIFYYIAFLIGEYYEYKGHSDVLKTVDYEFSEKWNKLWKWNIGLWIGMICSILILFISIILGCIVLFGCLIGIIIVKIKKIIYLYQTSMTLKNYSPVEDN